jgi:hypothetical protein
MESMWSAKVDPFESTCERRKRHSVHLVVYSSLLSSARQFISQVLPWAPRGSRNQCRGGLVAQKKQLRGICMELHTPASMRVFLRGSTEENKSAQRATRHKIGHTGHWSNCLLNRGISSRAEQAHINRHPLHFRCSFSTNLGMPFISAGRVAPGSFTLKIPISARSSSVAENGCPGRSRKRKHRNLDAWVNPWRSHLRHGNHEKKHSIKRTFAPCETTSQFSASLHEIGTLGACRNQFQLVCNEGPGDELFWLSACCAPKSQVIDYGHSEFPIRMLDLSQIRNVLRQIGVFRVIDRMIGSPFGGPICGRPKFMTSAFDKHFRVFGILLTWIVQVCVKDHGIVLSESDIPQSLC